MKNSLFTKMNSSGSILVLKKKSRPAWMWKFMWVCLFCISKKWMKKCFQELTLFWFESPYFSNQWINVWGMIAIFIKKFCQRNMKCVTWGYCLCLSEQAGWASYWFYCKCPKYHTGWGSLYVRNYRGGQHWSECQTCGETDPALCGSGYRGWEGSWFFQREYRIFFQSAPCKYGCKNHQFCTSENVCGLFPWGNGQ